MPKVANSISRETQRARRVSQVFLRQLKLQFILEHLFHSPHAFQLRNQARNGGNLFPWPIILRWTLACRERAGFVSGRSSGFPCYSFGLGGEKSGSPRRSRIVPATSKASRWSVVVAPGASWTRPTTSTTAPNNRHTTTACSPDICERQRSLLNHFPSKSSCGHSTSVAGKLFAISEWTDSLRNRSMICVGCLSPFFFEKLVKIIRSCLMFLKWEF